MRDSMKSEEEKYKEAYRKFKGWLSNQAKSVRESAISAEIFPELPKSDNEEIRKLIIKILNIVVEKQSLLGHCLDDIDWDNCIEWLEKQGKTAEEILILKDQIESLQAALVAKEETWKTRFDKLERPEWSEEDKNRLRNLCFLVEHSGEGEATQKGFINWIKSFRPLADLTWTEEDGKMFDSIIWHLRNSVNNGNRDYSAGQLEHWLEARCTSWRPDERELEALKTAIDYWDYVEKGAGYSDNYTKPNLERLYKRLEKLK